MALDAVGVTNIQVHIKKGHNIPVRSSCLATIRQIKLETERNDRYIKEYYGGEGIIPGS